MAEWSMAHAWKLTPAARADAHEIPPTHSRSTTSHNNDTRRRVPVNHGVAPRFGRVCDTVLTQRGTRLATGISCTWRSGMSSVSRILTSSRTAGAELVPLTLVDHGIAAGIHASVPLNVPKFLAHVLPPAFERSTRLHW